MGYIRKDGLQAVNLALWPSLVDALDEYADDVGSTRTDVVRRLIVGKLREVKLWPRTTRRVEKVALVDLAPSKRPETRGVEGEADSGGPIAKVGKEGAPIVRNRGGSSIVKRRRDDKRNGFFLKIGFAFTHQGPVLFFLSDSRASPLFSAGAGLSA